MRVRRRFGSSSRNPETPYSFSIRFPILHLVGGALGLAGRLVGGPLGLALELLGFAGGLATELLGGALGLAGQVAAGGLLGRVGCWGGENTRERQTYIG